MSLASTRMPMFNASTIPASCQPRAQGLTPAAWAAESFALEATGLTLMRGRRVVLHSIDMALAPGEMVGLHGDNGAGKTTLLQCLAGELQPTEGAIRWFGQTPGAAEARAQIGFLGHESGLYLALTAQENLVFAGRMYGLDHIAERAERLLRTMGLEQRRRQQAGCLSRGLKQRLAIARAVMHEPPILLLDEPFTSLDAGGRDILRRFLQGLRDHGCAILVASHDVQSDMFDRAVVLNGGRLQTERRVTEPHHLEAWRA